jgi:hypothetical protein
MTAAFALALWLAAAPGAATPGDVGAMLERIGDADLVLVNDPQGARPVRVLLATRVRARPAQVRQVLATPASYGKAMPAFQRVEVVGRQERAAGASDLQVAWELDVPLWNLKGKLWLRPRPDGADLELAEGDLAPGLFHLTVRESGARKAAHTILVIDGFANVAQANLATRELVARSPLAEPAMTVAAAYVMLRSLARLAEDGAAVRPTAAFVAPESASLDTRRTGNAALAFPRARGLVAAVRSRPDGRLAGVEVAMAAAASTGKQVGGAMRPESFAALPGWKKIETVDAPDTCRDPDAACWEVATNLPLFSLDGTWKIRRRPWRARMVAGDREGALMGLDAVTARRPAGTAIVLSEHPRLDRAGYVPRKLIAAEPYLEHGLALALTLVDAASLIPALERAR